MPDLQPRFIVDRLEAIERVERVRQAHNLTKGRFAMTLGMAPSNYSRVLKGDFFLTLDQGSPSGSFTTQTPDTFSGASKPGFLPSF